MKKLLFLILFTSTLSFSFSQLRFGVSPVLTYKGATFGYKINKFVPTLSLFVVHFGGTYTDAQKEFNAVTGTVVDNLIEEKIVINAIVPTLGLQYYLSENKSLKTYATANFSPLILSGKYTDKADPFFADDVNEDIKNIKGMGTQFGFGSEYFFSEQFSLSGEFGFQIISFKYKNTFTNTYFDSNTGNSVEYDEIENYKVNLSPIYTRISLNFLFGTK